MGFKVGQEVVCIDSSNGYGINKPSKLVKNETYTITEIDEVGDVGVNNGYDYLYDPTRFRKVEPKKETETATFKILREFKESEIIKEVDVIEKPNPVDA